MKTTHSPRFALIGLAALAATSAASILSSRTSFSSDYTDGALAGKKLLGIDASDGGSSSTVGDPTLNNPSLKAAGSTAEVQQQQQIESGEGGEQQQQGLVADTEDTVREGKGTIVKDDPSGAGQVQQT